MNDEQKNLNQQNGYTAPQHNVEEPKAIPQSAIPPQPPKAQEPPRAVPPQAPAMPEAQKEMPTETPKMPEAQNKLPPETPKVPDEPIAPRAAEQTPPEATVQNTAMVPFAAEPTKNPPKKDKKEKQEKKVEDPPRYKKHEVLRAFTGVIKFILILLLGMIIAYGSIAGAVFFAVGGLTIDMLQDWGIVGDIEYLTDGGEVDLTATTLLQLINDLNAISENLQNYSLNTLMAHYGVALPQETLDTLPAELLDIPLDQLTSEESVNVIMENVKLGYLLAFFPDGLLSAPVKEKLKDRPLALLTNGKYEELLADVYLGYFLGVTFDENDNVIYQDPEQYTMQETVAKLDLGSLIGALTTNGDLLGVMASDLGEQPVRPFISGIMSGALLEKMCEGRLIKDVLLPDDVTGKYTFSFAALSEGVYLGDTLGYTLVDGVWYSTYTDDGDDTNDVKVSTMYATLADISLVDVINNQVSLDACFDGLYFGDLQNGYVRGDAIMGMDEATHEPVVVGYEWFRDGKRVAKVPEKLANVMINTVLNGQLDVAAVLGDLMIGDLQGYEKDEDGKWYKTVTPEGGVPTKEYMNAIGSALADVSLADVMNGQLDIAGTLSALYLGDVQGFEKGTDDKWYKDGVYVGDVKNAIAGISLSGVMNGELDIAGTLSSLYLGDVQGFEKGTDDKWYKDGAYVGDVKNAIADISLSAVMNGELDIAGTLSALYLGDVQGYEKDADGKWYRIVTPEGGEPTQDSLGAVENALANIALSDVMNGNFSITAALGDLRLGETMDYIRGEVTTPADPADPDSYDIYQFFKPATTPGAQPEEVIDVALEIANIPLAHMIEGKVGLADTMRSFTLAEALGYEKHGDTWYSTYLGEGNVGNVEVKGILAVLADKKINELDSATIYEFTLADVLGYKLQGGKWYDKNGVEVTGVLSALANKTIGELNSATINTLTLADMLSYKQQGGKWYDNNGAEVTGVLAALANKTIGELNGETINNLLLADVLGYKKTSGQWRDKGGVVITGVLAALADKKISELNSTTINGILLGDVLGYTHKDTNSDGVLDTWFDGNALATGIMVHFADLTIGDLSNSSLVGDCVKKMTLAEAMGYEKHGGTWYSTYYGEGDARNVAVTGILGVLAEKKLSELNSGTIDSLYLGEALGYTKVLDKWYQNGAPVKGMMATLADLTIGQLADSHAVSAKLDELYLYDVLDYELIDGKWVSHDGTKTASGVMAHLMDIQIANIEDEIDEMPLGYAFGFYYDNNTKEWFTDAEHTQKPTGVAAAMANIHLTHAREEFDKMTIGAILGYEMKDTDADGVADTWYTGNAKLEGLNLVFADLLVADLGDDDKISDAIQGAHLGDALGFKKSGNVWYKTKKDAQNNNVIDLANPVVGVMGALADSKIGEIESDIQSVSIGAMLNFTKKADGWYDAADKKLNGVMAILASSDLDNVAGNIDNMTVEDLWPEREGVLAALDDDVRLLELNVAVQNLTVAQLRDAGVLAIDAMKAAKLELMLGKKLDKVTLPEFINALVNLIP